QNGNMRKESGRWMGVWLALLPLGLLAQQHGFVYIQSENRLPFTASWDAANYRSDSSGYLLIPQLPAGTQQIRIQANRGSAELRFNIYMEQVPKGFTLRQKADNSWVLFDMVDYREIKGMAEPVSGRSRNAYLSPLDPVPGSATTAQTATESRQAAAKQPAVARPAFEKPEAIRLLFQKAGADGVDQVYLIEQSGRKDTIAVFIPALKTKLPPPSAGNPALPELPGRENLIALVPK
ncbi:MAG TPA: hypothetical protein VG842_02780, partial [Sediminibacterium sp.]|nr:hypothetical protein [Sediminibacterium sp.]